MTGPILLIDDEEKLRDALVRNLTRAGYVCHAVGTAEEALDWLALNTPAAILLDIMLDPKGAPGWAVAGYTKAHSRFKDVQVIVISGLDPELIRAGARTYVNQLSHSAIICGKPIDLQHILNVLENLPSTPPPPPATEV